MKVGDKIVHKRRNDPATIIKVVVTHYWDDFQRKTKIKTKYVARYDTGAIITFNGFDIGKSVIEYEPNVQLSFFDSIN